MNKTIEVVDTSIFKEKLQIAEVAIPLAELFLTNKKAVAKFFKVHVNTITNWIENNVFQEGVHYLKEEEKLVFIPLALLQHKANPPKPKQKAKYKPSDEAKALLA
jgi:P2-related tail formation protein